MLKIFVFEKEDTSESCIIEHEIDPKAQAIDLSELVKTYCCPDQYRISIYDPKTFKFVLLSQIILPTNLIPSYIFEPTFILFRYIEKGSDIIDHQTFKNTKDLELEYPVLNHKYKKNKEKTIRQVIEVIKRWRDLNAYGQTTKGSRINLQDAAQAVGVSKKTLDDFYYNLRIAEQYGFDFESNLEQKVRVLRKFIKENQIVQGDLPMKKNNSHPKNLEVIDFYDMKSRTIKKLKRIVNSKSEQRNLKEISDDSEMYEQVFKQFQSEPVSIQRRGRLSQKLFSQFARSECKFERNMNNLQRDFFQGFQTPLAEEDFRKIQSHVKNDIPSEMKYYE